MTERERMLAGELYDPGDPELQAAAGRSRALLRAFAGEADRHRRRVILRDLLGGLGEGAVVVPPFFCDYGEHIEIGARAFLNTNCVILDCNRVVIGDDVLIGPAVQIYAATHPVEPEGRLTGREYALPVSVGDGAWIGGGAILGPGVTVGEGATVGAGSVVVRDVPPRTVVVGNFARVVRRV